MGGGSLWLLKEPIYCNLASRCVPVCTNLAKILRKKHSGAKNLVGVVNNVLGVVDDEMGGAPPVELPENIKEILCKLWQLFIELKEVDIEWPFWRQVSVLAIAINRIFLLSSCDFDTVVTFRTSRYKYHTTGVSSLLLGRIIADMNLVLKALVNNISSDSSSLPEGLKESLTIGYKMAGYVQYFIKTGCHEPDISLDEFVDEGEESEVDDRDEYLAELAESKLNIRLTEENILETYHLIHAIVPKVLSDITSIGFYPFRCLPCEYKYPDFSDSFITFRIDRASKPPYCDMCKLPLPSLQSYKAFFSNLTNHHWTNPFAASRSFEKMKSIISHRTTNLVTSSSLPPRAIPANPDSKVSPSDSQEVSGGDSLYGEDGSEKVPKVPISSLKNLHQKKRAMLLQIKNSRQRAIYSRLYRKSDTDGFYDRSEREKLKSDSSGHFVSVLNVLRHKRALKRRQLQHQLHSLANNSKTNVTLRDILARGIATSSMASSASGQKQASSRPGSGNNSRFYSPFTRVLNDLLSPDATHPSGTLGGGLCGHNSLPDAQSSSGPTSLPSSHPVIRSSKCFITHCIIKNQMWGFFLDVHVHFLMVCRSLD